MMYTILLISFFIGFISDLVLNYLSRQTYVPMTYMAIPASIKALKIYFKRKSIKSAPWRVFISAFNAGLTVAAALVLTMGIYYFLPLGRSNKFFPETLKELLIFLALAFPVGYAMDVIIYKTQLFGPTLNPYYNIVGSGLWGALAIIFAFIVTFFLYKLYKMYKL